MRKTFLTMLLMAATFISAQTEFAGKYAGSLYIGGTAEEGGEPAENDGIYILPGVEEQTVNFVLPDFSFLGINLGNIVLIGVPASDDGSLNLSGYPLYMPLLETRVGIDITEGSGVIGDSITINLMIDVPGLGTIPVYFFGNRVTANYQPRNPGFEGEWDQVSLTAGKTTINGVEPAHWNSYITGSGDLISAAANNKQLKESTLVRPGSKGQKSAVITSNVLLGVKANGNITTGRLNGGSMSVADSTLNYNYTQTDNDDFCLPFAGKPDSMVVWVRYIPADGDINNAANVANVSAVLHTDGYYQEPAVNCVAERTGAARQNIHGVSGNDWQRLAIPFNYETANNPAYALITFTTCAQAGGGSSAGTSVDSLYMDDIEMIYNAELASFSIDGAAIDWLSGRVASSTLAWSDSSYVLEATATGVDAKTFIGYNTADTVITVIVAGSDYPGNTANYKTYLLGLNGKMPTPQVDPTPDTIPDIETSLTHNFIQTNCHVWGINGCLCVESAEAMGELPLYTADGRLIRKQRILAGTNIIPGLEPGFYIIAGKKAIVY